MQSVSFPHKWMLGIDSIPSLACRLQISEEDLRCLLKEIPHQYRYKKLPNRTLRIPSNNLKGVQRSILENLFAMSFPPYVHGGVHNRSILTNAKTHLHGEWVLRMDIRSFFPSVNYKRIENIFLSLGCSRESAVVLTQLTTLDRELPQGAPTSPVLANLVLYNVDRRIDGLCQKMRFRYSRYFDDIAISGPENPEKILPLCKKFLRQENFHLNNKTGITKSRNGCVITGILVKQGALSISPELQKKIHADLVCAAQGEFTEDPIKMKDRLRGQIAFLKNIDAREWLIVRALFARVEWEN